MSSEHQEVRGLLYELAKKIKSSHTEFTGKCISMSLHGMKSMSSDHEEVRLVLNELTKKINESDADIIGCLLYTSPSPRDRQKSRMPSSA